METIPPNDAPVLEIINGKFTGRLDWRWRLYFINREVPRLVLTADVTLPPCPPQSSVDSAPINFPGLVPDAGMVIVVGLPSALVFTVNNSFECIITAADTFILREVCADAFGIGGFTYSYTFMAFASQE